MRHRTTIVAMVSAVMLLFVSASVASAGGDDQSAGRLSSANHPLHVGADLSVFPSPCQSTAPAESAMDEVTVLLSENFDATWGTDPDPNDPYLVPVGWDIDGLCIGTQEGVPWATHYWRQFGDGAYPFTHTPPHCAGLWWSDGSYPDPPDGAQDEWLISPEIDVSDYRQIDLTFYSVYTMLRWGAGDTAHDYIQVSTDQGETWTVVADLAHDPEYDFDTCTGGVGGYGWNWNEIPIEIDLSLYAGSPSIMIAFRYQFTMTQGNIDRGLWMVDDVLLRGIQTPTLAVHTIGGKFFRINATVSNIGDANATDVTWTISVKGGRQQRINVSAEGSLAVFPVDDLLVIQTHQPILGLGAITITVSVRAGNAATVTKTATAVVLFFYITNIIIRS